MNAYVCAFGKIIKRLSLAAFLLGVFNGIPVISANSSNLVTVGLEFQADERVLPKDKAYEMIRCVAETAYIQRNWKQWLTNPELTSDDMAVARSKGLHVYAALDLLSYDDIRGHVALADGKSSGKFADHQTKADYLKLVAKVAEQHPDYFVLLVEANMYRDHDPDDYEAFRKLLPEAVKIVRAKSPNTLVGVSITYGDHNNKDGLDADDNRYFSERVKDFESSTDMLCVSTYPMYLLNPNKLPPDFIHTICSFSSRPLFLAETSWTSASFKIPINPFFSYKIISSPERQADYYRRLLQSADLALQSGDRVLCINFVSLTDPRPVASALFQIIKPEFSWFTSLAVCDCDGRPKPAYTYLKERRVNNNGHNVDKGRIRP